MRIFFLLVCAWVGFSTKNWAQEPAPQRARFARQEIGKTGLKLAFPIETKIDAPETDDQGNQTFSIVCDFNGTKYSAIVMKFAEPLPVEGNSNKEVLKLKEETLAGILVDLCESVGFDPTNKKTMGFGHTKEDFPDLVGVIDYWGNSEQKTRAAVKAWMDNHFIVTLMIVYEADKEPIFNYQQLFLDGILPPK